VRRAPHVTPIDAAGAGAAGAGENGAGGSESGSSSGGMDDGGRAANQSGRGGTGGAGVASAGTSASAGTGNQCVDGPAWPLGCDRDLSLTSTCTFEATCREVRCGQPSSEFDANGCERTHCVASEDCASDERCVAAPLLGDFSCAPAYFEGCSVSGCGQCICDFDPSCHGVSYCLPADEHPPADDCPIPAHTYCAVYEHDAAMLANYLDQASEGTGDTQAALRACRDKLQVELERCARQANGGGGTSGGAPNAEAGASNGG
jgi:hypothetical protein